MKGMDIKLFVSVVLLLGLGYPGLGQVDGLDRLSSNLKRLQMLEAELEAMYKDYEKLEVSYERLIAIYREQTRMRTKEEKEAWELDPSLRDHPLILHIGRRMDRLRLQLGEESVQGLRWEGERQRILRGLAWEADAWNLLLEPGGLRMDPGHRWEQLLQVGQRVTDWEEAYRYYQEQIWWQSEMQRREHGLRKANQRFYDRRKREENE